ncbi:MAG: VCBS repeat-containing protein [Proteobacteria bacterium]|nr:VCBS repeat-containing protein [Pseudomonadota bacterium]
MQNPKSLFFVFISALAMYGCNDESSTSTNTPAPAPTPECQSGADCDSGVCNEDGTCAPKKEEKKPECDDDNPCKKPQKCFDGKCKTPEGYCESDDDCKDDKICVEESCIDITWLNEGDECKPLGKEAQCQAPLICQEGTCQPPKKIIDKDNPCTNDEDCADQDGKPYCLKTGLCGNIGELGEVCSDEVQCPDDMSCQTVCVHVKHENEPCNEETFDVCDEGLSCKEGACHIYNDKIQSGEECNESWLLCDEGLTCHDGICVTIVDEDTKCDEAKHIICKDEQACIGGVCKSVTGTCESTQDCKQKDSFCCKDDSCGMKGYCIPYNDTVTHDETCEFVTKEGIFEAQIQCRWQPPANNDYSTSTKVEMPPLVGPFGEFKTSKGKDIKNVIAVYSYDKRYTKTEETDQKAHKSAIRFINPETCDTLQTIPYEMSCAWQNYPSAADLNNDGLFELIVIDSKHRPVAFKWDASKKQYAKWWTGEVTTGDVPMIFDIDNDKNPEIILGDAVINGKTGKTIFAGTLDKEGKPTDYTYRTLAVGYLDTAKDGLASMAISSKVQKWDKTNKNWKVIARLPKSRTHLAYADFGTPGKEDKDFNFSKLDGKPEIVSAGGGTMSIYALTPSAKGDGTYDVQTVMDVTFTDPIGSTSDKPQGGPITIGDFDSDGFPEIGIASSGFFGVYDPRCPGYKKGEKGECADKNVLWERWSQDASSGQTGSSLFDFDGDGRAEAVYADECFTRIYDGKTGKVLFSAKRSSSTSIEAPTIADIDGDGSAEIVMGSDNNISCYHDTYDPNDTTGEKTKYSPTNSEHAKLTDFADPIHEGIPCLADEDCPLSKNCDTNLKLCLCQTDADCNTQNTPTLKPEGKKAGEECKKDADCRSNNCVLDTKTNKKTCSNILQQYVCAPPIHSQVGMMVNSDGKGRKMVKPRGTRPNGWKEGDYQVCRATRKTRQIGNADMMIFKDRLDRWVSSRNIWNQHSYNIINIEDNGKVPDNATWLKNWNLKNDKKNPVYNNYRLNKQGTYGAGKAPDITGRFLPGDICGQTEDGEYIIKGKLCNRGTKPVSQNLPATFFYYDENNEKNHQGKAICTSYTQKVVGVGECSEVGCTITKEELDALAGQKLLMVANLNEKGLASTIECNTENNTDTITVDKCVTKIEVVN